MFAFFAHPLAAGRSSIPRGIAGALIAPSLGFLLIPVPLFAFVMSDDWSRDPPSTGQVGSGFAILGLVFLKVLATALIVGVPVWLVLRWLKRESGAAYAMTGGLGAIVAGHGRSPLDFFRSGDAAGMALYGLGGVLIGLSFWLIAREPAGGAPVTGTAS